MMQPEPKMTLPQQLGTIYYIILGTIYAIIWYVACTASGSSLQGSRHIFLFYPPKPQHYYIQLSLRNSSGELSKI